MKKTLRTMLACLSLALLLAMSAHGLEIGSAEVTASLLNFREGPTTSSKIIGTAPRGEIVEILEVLDGWCRVSYQGKTGYMSADYLRNLSAEEAEAPAEAPAPAEAEPEEAPQEETAQETLWGTLTGNSVRLRTGPSTSDGVTRYLFRGDRVQILGTVGDWQHVLFGEEEGYVFAKYITEDKDLPEGSELVKSIIQTAKDQLGIRYVYGGASPGTGFDCSGLVYYCFTQNGQSIERTASRQYRLGTNVEKADLIPGDLVFFASSSGWAIAHVGIYLGDGEFIHASSGGARIMVSRLDEKYWSKYYYGARRLLSEEE